MKLILISTIFALPFITFATDNKTVILNTKNNGTINVHIDDKIYLNACGGNPDIYSLNPSVFANILYEVPNIITSFDKSPFGRPFRVHAKSTWKNNGQEVKAELGDFREIKIIDNKTNNILYKEKISGATSIYELKHHNTLIGWGVGWHKTCYEYYPKVDFTSFRAFIPYPEDSSIKIQTQLLNGIAENKFVEAIKNSSTLVLTSTRSIGAGAYGCYYCLPLFWAVDNKLGIKELSNMQSLLAFKVDIEKINPFIFMSWLAYNRDLESLKGFISKNFEQIVEGYSKISWKNYINGKEVTYEHLGQNQSKCKKYLASNTRLDLTETVQNCFPDLIEKAHDKYLSDVFFLPEVEKASF